MSASPRNEDRKPVTLTTLAGSAPPAGPTAWAPPPAPPPPREQTQRPPPPQEDPQPRPPPPLAGMRALGEPIVMVTAYDHPSAQVAEAAGVDMVLVGDSAAMTVLGYDSTVPVSTEELLMLCRAVRRGLKTPLLVGAPLCRGCE